MNKRFRTVLLCSAISAFAMGTFSSCDNNNDELETKVGVLETAVKDLQEQLGKALTTGMSVTNATQDSNGAWTLTLSDGTTVKTGAAGGGAGGGSDVNVVVTDSEAIITVNGTEYRLPLGSSVSSLIYAPEYADGKVKIADASGAEVMLLARPALDNLNGAVFTVAESHQLKTRAADGDDFKVNGAELRDGFVVVKLLCLNQDIAGQEHAVSIQLNYRGTMIGSNFFNVEVDPDFSFVSEALDENITCNAEGASKADDGSWSFTLDGLKLGAGDNFAQYFNNLPEGATFKVASSGKQPGGAAQEKQPILAASLNTDGSFAWAARPGSSFNDNEEQQGFLVNIVKDEVTVAKFYVKINDTVANADFVVFGSDMEAEWGGRAQCLQLGAQRVDIQAWLSAASDLQEPDVIVHNGREGVIDVWDDVIIADTNDDNLIVCKEGHLTLTDLGKSYAPEGVCRGIYWYNRGLSIRLPESMVPYTYFDGSVYENGGGEGWGKDFFINGDDMWMGQYNEYANDPVGFYANYPTWNYLGLQIDEKTGDLITPESYTGWGFRLAVGVAYEYLYGIKPIIAEGNDKLGMIFFNRRLAPEGANMPVAEK